MKYLFKSRLRACQQKNYQTCTFFAILFVVSIPQTIIRFNSKALVLKLMLDSLVLKHNGSKHNQKSFLRFPFIRHKNPHEQGLKSTCFEVSRLFEGFIETSLSKKVLVGLEIKFDCYFQNSQMSFKEQLQCQQKNSHSLEIQTQRKCEKEVDQANTGKWTEYQHAKYIMFLHRHRGKFACRLKKRKIRLFEQMSQFMHTRSTIQCRTHHQKFESKVGSTRGIVEAYRKIIGQDNFKKISRQFSRSGNSDTLEKLLSNPQSQASKVFQKLDVQVKEQLISRAELQPSQDDFIESGQQQGNYVVLIYLFFL